MLSVHIYNGLLDRLEPAIDHFKEPYIYPEDEYGRAEWDLFSGAGMECLAGWMCLYHHSIIGKVSNCMTIQEVRSYLESVTE